jgi:amino acid permease
VVESWFFGSWEKTRKRQMCKNLTRTIIVALTCVVALTVYDKCDKLLSLTGALTCIPVAFIIPTGLHLKLIATPNNDGKAKIIDICILALSIIMLVYCTIMGAIDFGKD